MAVATRGSFPDDHPVHSFEEEWPELARRLDRFLAAKGVEPWLRADISQETAARLFGRWSKIDRSRPLWNLVVTVALRTLIDEHRRTSKVELVADTPQAELNDVENRALHRVHLENTHSALSKLRADQRQVLLAEIGAASAIEGPRNRINVLRLRARLALKGELGPLAPAGVAMRVRSLRAAIERRLVEWKQDDHAVIASAACVAMAATLLGVGPPPVGVEAEQVEPKRATAEQVALGGFLSRDPSLRSALRAIKRGQAPSLSRTKEQVEKKAPAFAICAAVVCSSPEDPLVVGPASSNDVLKKIEDGLREGDRQLRRGEKKVRRVLMDPPLPYSSPPP